jgi:hypothetical protein
VQGVPVGGGEKCSFYWGEMKNLEETIRKPMVLFFLLMFLNAKIGLVFKGKSSPETMVLTMKYG